MPADLWPYPAYRDSGVEWLGRVPEHWEVRRLGATTERIVAGTWGSDPTGRDDIVCVRVADFDRQRLDVDLRKPTLRSVPDAERQGRRLDGGDLLLEKSGGGDLQPVGTVVHFDHDQEAVASNFIGRMRVRAQNSSRYVLYLNSVLYAIRLTVRSIKQTTGIQNLDVAAYLDEPIPLPPLSEQTAIAGFLDHVDARIRRYIRAKERLIELLEEQKRATIHQAVTGQIDVRTGKPYPAYKDSRMEWLGEVPEHWGLVANKAMLSRRKVLVGESHTQFRLLSLTKSGVIVRDLSTGRGKFSADMGTSQEVWKGDLVFCLFDVPETPRTVGLSGHDGMITGAYTVFECDRPLLRQFLEAFYIAMDDRKLLEPLYSGLRNTIPPSRFLGAKTPVPSRDEQAAILGYLHDSRTVADSAVTLAKRQVELLNEYRTRLIADVVTGKLDVREAAASLPEVDPLNSDETPSAPEPNAASALESPGPAPHPPHP